MNELPVIFADFNNVDADGRIRLNCVGTNEDLVRLGISFVEFDNYVFSDGELSVNGRVVKTDEGIWAAEICWDEVKGK